jgi:hypothetical protein
VAAGIRCVWVPIERTKDGALRDCTGGNRQICEKTRDGSAPLPAFVVVLNWLEELKALQTS